MLDEILIAVSLANLMLMWEWLNGFHPEFLVHNIHPVSTNGVFAFTFIFLSYFLFFIVLLRLCASSNKFTAKASSFVLVLFFCLPWFHFRDFYHLGSRGPLFFSPGNILGNWGQFTRLKYFLFATSAFYLFWKYSSGLTRVARAVSLILFPFFFLTFGNLYWKHFFVSTGELEPSLLPNSQLKTRTLWIVFDSFDYNYSFTLRERETKLRYPELDRFKSESSSFSHAIAPTPMTTYSMSSYLLGKTVTEFSLYPYKTATETVLETGETLLLKDQETVLSSAKKLGATVGIIGWHVPYCGLFEKQMDHCVWFSPTQWPYQSSIFKNSVFAFKHSLFQKTNLSEIRREIYNLTLEKSLALIKQDLPNLTLLHFPTPHYPSINHESEELRNTPDEQEIASYYSNLLLADRALGEIRTALEKANKWESTTVIVTSDHWLRYAPSSYMEKYGKTLFEIPLMVKLAGRNAAKNYDNPTPTLKISDLLLGTLSNKDSYEALRTWVNHNTVPDLGELIKKILSVSGKIYGHSDD